MWHFYLASPPKPHYAALQEILNAYADNLAAAIDRTEVVAGSWPDAYPGQQPCAPPATRGLQARIAEPGPEVRLTMAAGLAASCGPLSCVICQQIPDPFHGLAGGVRQASDAVEAAGDGPGEFHASWRHRFHSPDE
jgi:hypothetical protein